MGLIKVILYVAFMVIMVRIYTLPLFALRPMYYTIRNFKKAFNDVILSRRAIHNMNTLYPDATLEELQAGDNVCIICREEMTTAAKKLPCNHIFHASCLRSWFQRQQTCPTCRLNILRTPTQPTTENRPRVPEAQRDQINQLVNPFMFMNARNLNQQNQQRADLPPPNIPNMNNFVPGATGVPPANGAPGAGLPPFFPFPPMPFMVPPPMPPPNLSNISTEQLRRLEGNERENVEARIQWLRNIQVMLDAAVLMMQQYSTAAAISMTMPNAPSMASQSSSATGTATTETPNEPSNSAAASSPGPSTPSSSAPNENGKNSPTLNSTPTAASELSSGPSTSASAVGESTSDQENSPEAEVRRRRLQKFLQQEQT